MLDVKKCMKMPRENIGDEVMGLMTRRPYWIFQRTTYGRRKGGGKGSPIFIYRSDPQIRKRRKGPFGEVLSTHFRDIERRVGIESFTVRKRGVK